MAITGATPDAGMPTGAAICTAPMAPAAPAMPAITSARLAASAAGTPRRLTAKHVAAAAASPIDAATAGGPGQGGASAAPTTRPPAGHAT
ncbi:MAG: type II and III secretion system protein family protein, partial [Planctomycetia bacterium]